MKFLNLELRALSLAFVSLLTAADAPAADLDTSKNLFFIKRNKNANEVHYDARVQNCAWRQSDEVDYYWRDLEEGPKITSEIQLWEPPAYGFNLNRLSDSEITIRLNALPEKEITARLSKTEGGGCSVSTTIKIDAKPAELRSVYVYAVEKTLLGIPYGATVHYIFILGYLQDGQPVFESILKTKQGEQLAASPPKDSLWKSSAIPMGRP